MNTPRVVGMMHPSHNSFLLLHTKCSVDVVEECIWLQLLFLKLVQSPSGTAFLLTTITSNNSSLMLWQCIFFLVQTETTAEVNTKKVSGKHHNPPYHYRFHRSWWRGIVVVVVVISNASHFSLSSTVECRKTNYNNQSSWMWLSVVALVWMEMGGKSVPFASTQACFINKTYITQEVQSTIERW